MINFQTLPENVCRVIEKGENFEAYSNGLLICHGTIEIQSANFTSWGNLYQFEVASQKFPKKYKSVPAIYVSSNNVNNQYNYCGFFGTYQTSVSESGIIKLVRPLATNGPIQINWTSIGFWK